MPVIGRLHKVEASDLTEFDNFKPGDKLNAKVLKVIKENGKTWIELTMRKAHMTAEKLDADLLKLLSFDSIDEGQTLKALVTDVAA